MKPRIQQLICLIVLLWIPSMIFSQTVDEIIEKHIAAHGGAEIWNAVNALKITGKFTAFSLEEVGLDGSCWAEPSVEEFEPGSTE